MPDVCRIGDPFATGHPCDGQSVIAEGSANVFANGIAVSRRGDSSAVHAVLRSDKCVPHAVPIAGGSSTVFVNGIAVARVGDGIDAGAISGGSPNVRAGG